MEDFAKFLFPLLSFLPLIIIGTFCIHGIVADYLRYGRHEDLDDK